MTETERVKLYEELINEIARRTDQELISLCLSEAQKQLQERAFEVKYQKQMERGSSLSSV